MCGSSLDPRLAERLAIDIVVEGAGENFRLCAETIHLTINDYHSRIAEAIVTSEQTI